MSWIKQNMAYVHIRCHTVSYNVQMSYWSCESCVIWFFTDSDDKSWQTPVVVILKPGTMLRLSSQDLLPWILGCLPAACVVRLGRTSKELHKISCCQHSLATMAESSRIMEGNDPSVLAMIPKEKQKWSLERLYLCQSPPSLSAISFAFASDAISINAHHELERIAAILVKHSGLRCLGRQIVDSPIRQ